MYIHNVAAMDPQAWCERPHEHTAWHRDPRWKTVLEVLEGSEMPIVDAAVASMVQHHVQLHGLIRW